jgi:hypothetical protein
MAKAVSVLGEGFGAMTEEQRWRYLREVVDPGAVRDGIAADPGDDMGADAPDALFRPVVNAHVLATDLPPGVYTEDSEHAPALVPIIAALRARAAAHDASTLDDNPVMADYMRQAPVENFLSRADFLVCRSNTDFDRTIIRAARADMTLNKTAFVSQPRFLVSVIANPGIVGFSGAPSLVEQLLAVWPAEDSAVLPAAIAGAYVWGDDFEGCYALIAPAEGLTAWWINTAGRYDRRGPGPAYIDVAPPAVADSVGCWFVRGDRVPRP